MRRNLYIPGDLYDFAKASGNNASGYIQLLLQHRQVAYARAQVLLDAAGYTEADILAVAEAQNGHLYTEGMSTRDEIVFNLEDAAWIIQKHKANSDRLLGMGEDEAQALRLVVEEFWAGRKLWHSQPGA